MKISICLATYNGSLHIREQLDSILAQDLSSIPDAEMEIIVSDDMSTDDTVAIIDSYEDSRITIISHVEKRHTKHYNALHAATANFANAMEHATGEYIFLSDQDDRWYPNKVASSIALIQQNGGGYLFGRF